NSSPSSGSSSPRSHTAAGVQHRLVVRGVLVVAREQATGLGRDVGALVVLAGELLDGVDRIEQEQRRELDAVGGVATKHVRAAEAAALDEALDPGQDLAGNERLVGVRLL